jgi:hypothetical protein
MTLLRKSSTLFLMAMFTIMSVLLGAAASHIVIPSSAFAQTSSSLIQDIFDSAQQEEETDSSSSAAVSSARDNTNTDIADTSADDNTQTDTNTQSFDLDLNQDVEAEVENEAEQATGNLVLPDQDDAQEDTTPPTLTVPEDITEEVTSSDGAVVTFTVTAEDDVDGTATLDENDRLIQDDVGGDITISCSPPSGSTFPIGESVVECTATDEAGNTATESFTVTVVIGCAGEPATIVGTPGDDNLVGTDGRDVIAALAGNDRVEARGGDDLICGDAGDDVMIGEDGHDSLNSVDGVVNNDNLDGGTGTDTCTSDPDPEVNCELP